MHIEEHPYAFLDAEGVVVNVAVFIEHNDLLATTLAKESGGVSAISLCDAGNASIGWQRVNDLWKPISPFASWVWNGATWQAPIARPTDDKRYTWDEATTSWIEVQ
jgi:hypothetical protein